MEDYPSNSQKKPEPVKGKKKEKIEPVVITGDIIRRKRPLGKRFSETFFSGADARSVMGYVFLDVMIPAAKDMIFDAGSEALQRTLFGESRRAGRRGFVPSRYESPFGTVAYNAYSRASGSHGSRRGRDEPGLSRRARANHDFDEIIIPTRAEAEEILSRMYDLIGMYEVATVGDLYELAGEAGAYTDDRYGWTDLQGSSVTRVREGYLLDLPKPQPLD